MPTATYAQVEPAATSAPVEIVAFQHNGRLVAANLEAGSTATVEWASSLAGPWTNTWESLGEVKVGADGLLDVSVPMFFRVRGVGATTLPATTTSTPSTSSSTETVPVIPPSDDYLEIDPSTGPSTSSATPSTSSSPETAPVAPSSGDYLVIDLSAGPSASSYPVTYLTAVPAGGWTDEYKTTKLVVQRIPAGSFTMGSPSGEPGHRLGGDETQHQVTLTRDFYIGVFEVTQQ
ncbi:MAG: hypothetical protein O3B24_11785, partial [Verrucomicrobia bacterium]|nr:hypothetical protein [Verrucomicrobiota bacterium]